MKQFSKLALKNNPFSKLSIRNSLLKTNMSFFCDTNKNRFNKDFDPKDARSFGEKVVDPQEHQGLVNEIFRNVANKYDLMNDVMSLGVHRLWKTEFVNSIGHIRPITTKHDGIVEHRPMKIIDVAGGTGDIGFKILAKAEETAHKYLDTFPVDITIVDINEKMLEEGEKRAHEMGVSEKVKFKVCNAETLDFLEDNSVDLYTISFGIRNCTNRAKVLNEAYRVLRKGGRFMCMEFSEVIIPGLDQIYNFYSDNVIPELGGIFANDKESYKYLVESIRKFPKQDAFKSEIEFSGFSFVKYINLSAGICAIHSGIKLH